MQAYLFLAHLRSHRELRTTLISMREIRDFMHDSPLKAKALFVAYDIEDKHAGFPSGPVEDLVDLALENRVPVIFALRRQDMGRATGFDYPVSMALVTDAHGEDDALARIKLITAHLCRDFIRMLATVVAVAPDSPGRVRSAL